MRSYIIITEIAVGIYVLGTILLILIAASDMVFYRGVAPEPVGARFRKRVGAAFMWPLAILSPNGRKHFKQAWRGVTK